MADYLDPKTLLIGLGWVVLVAFLGPVMLAFAGCWVVYRLFMAYWEWPSVEAARNARKAQGLYEQACAAQGAAGFPSAEDFAERVWQQVQVRLPSMHLPSLNIARRLFPIAGALYRAEGFEVPPPPPGGATPLESARYRDTIAAITTKFSTPGIADLAGDTIADSLAAFIMALPAIAHVSPEGLVDAAQDASYSARLSIKLIDVLPNAGAAIQTLILPYYRNTLLQANLFTGVREQFDRNQHAVSKVPYDRAHFRSPKLINPADATGTADELAQSYFAHLPFLDLLYEPIPFDIPDAARFEHHWIVAGSGHGKSQTLQYLIGHDLEKVIAGGASVVVIDSQGDLIDNIAQLKVFAPGGPLHDKLCIIDPTDIEYPVALNLFDVGMERINQYSPLDRERILNGVLELYDFVLGSLLSAELTQKQSVIFRYITRLMIHIPGATIHTFRELMEPKGYEKYLPHIQKLDGTARAFFETEFNSKQFEDTKRQVVRRLWGILENQTFERMFAHPKNKLDLFAEMNAGKVILINTAKDLLKQNGTEIFGRFFIALVAQAAQERATLPKDQRMPTFVYVDECADYLDQNVALILEQARKFNVGMVLAHQYVGQLTPKLQDSFAANTSIKFAGGVSDKDARALANMLRTTPEFIAQQRKGHFAASVRNMTDTAVSLHIPFGFLEAMLRMTDSERARVREAMRRRYAVHWKEVHTAEAAGTPTMDPPPAKPKVDVKAAVEIQNPEAATAPSTEW